MDWLTDEEECVRINAREMSHLWSVLADWTESEDEEIWKQHVPVFSEIIARWDAQGYVEVYSGPEWPAHERGHRVAGAELTALLADPDTWTYHEDPDRVTTLLSTMASLQISLPPEARG
ncbi:hypothetical protein [Nocardia sp. NBC_01329]|uniref:hypothetical protein n=1 Tax=Nocardia sp. NBC_01329 TaxID=2903594 RepID=UPI002E1440DF|nr:hypothetical protein OG405_22250 [Nocardia sp. NBC_01329]